MLRLSTKGRYGTRVMLELALNYGEGHMLLKDIAKKQDISVGYLEQIMPSLKAAGFINASRGAHGGYTLARPPVEITLCEIVSALEGPISLVECISSPEVCDRVESCVTHDLWGEVSEKIESTLRSKNLQDLVYKHRNKVKSRPLMYSI
jgi:Rrf2 family protein